MPLLLVGFFIGLGLIRALAATTSQDKEGRRAHDVGIENHHWRIAKYYVNGRAGADGVGLVDATVFADITLRDGHVEGSSGCGGWWGSYQVSGDVLTVQAGTGLAGLCSSAAISQGGMVVRDFNRKLRIVAQGSDVLLTAKDGTAEILLAPLETR